MAVGGRLSGTWARAWGCVFQWCQRLHNLGSCQLLLLMPNYVGKLPNITSSCEKVLIAFKELQIIASDCQLLPD